MADRLSVAVQILLKDDFSGKLDGPIGKMDKLRDRAQAARTELLQTGAVMGGAFLASLSVAMKGAADYADEIAKASQKTGMLAEDISALRYAAGQSGVEFQALEMSIARMQRSAAEASEGSAMYADAYRALGVNVRNAGGDLKDGRTLFLELADALARTSNPTERAALAMQIFGRSGAQLLPLLNGGAAGIEALMERAETLGIVLDTETAQAAERFNDSLEDIEYGSKAIAMAITGAVIPSLSGMNEGFAEYLGGVANFIKDHPEATRVVIAFASALSGAAVGAWTLNQTIGLVRGTVDSIKTILEFYRARVLANAAALDTETLALERNTIAQGQNAGAAGRAAGARGVGGVGAKVVGGVATGGGILYGLHLQQQQAQEWKKGYEQGGGGARGVYSAWKRGMGWAYDQGVDLVAPEMGGYNPARMVHDRYIRPGVQSWSGYYGEYDGPETGKGTKQGTPTPPRAATPRAPAAVMSRPTASVQAQSGGAVLERPSAGGLNDDRLGSLSYGLPTTAAPSIGGGNWRAGPGGVPITSGSAREHVGMQVGPRGRLVRRMMEGGGYTMPSADLGGGISTGGAGGGGITGVREIVRDVNVFIGNEALDDRQREVAYEVVSDTVR